MRDITLGETFYHFFTTRAFATGVPTVLAGTPVLSVLEENNATPITAGVSVSVDRGSVVGLNQATIVATSGNGYEAGKSYAIYVSTGTVGGVSVIGEVVGEFTVQASAAFTRLGAPAGASVSADILVLDNLVDDLESRLGTPTDLGGGATVAANLADIEGQTDDIGIAGVGLTNLGGMSTTMKGQVQTEAEDALVVHRLDEMLNADSDIDGAAPPTVGSVVHELMSKTAGSFTFDQTTDSLEAIRDKETDIETDTAEIGAAGAGLTNINLPNQTMDMVGNITGNLSGSVGSVTVVSDKTGYALSATGSAALTESYAADGAAATLPQLLYLVLALLSEFAIAGTTFTAKKLDGATTAATFTLDSATAPTSITRAT